jgi:FkbM family methyltransferase
MTEIARWPSPSGCSLKSLIKWPFKMVALVVVQMVMWLRGWKFPRYFGLRGMWTATFIGIEPDLMNLTQREIRPGDTVLDVGANAGLVARHFCRCVGPAGRVFAFEPALDNLEALRFNMRRCPQAEVFALALSDENGTAVFYLNRVSGTGNSLVPHELGTTSMQVTCQTLDSFLAERPDIKPDWIKIDVEGAEFQVLRGMKQTVDRFPGLRLIVELCPGNLGGMDRAEKLVSELQALSFDISVIQLDGSVKPYRALSDYADRLATLGYVNLYAVHRHA